MGKHKNTTKCDTGAQKGSSSTPSSHDGEAGDTGDMVQDLMEEVASLEKVLSQMSASSKMPLKLPRPSRSPSEQSLSPEHK